jgi:transketolase
MGEFPLDAAVGEAPRQEPLRMGFGRGLYRAGRDNPAVMALCADLTDSTQMSLFREAFGDRFVEVGIAEQNLATVAAGMARAGRIPFTSSYAAFSPGRNWEQIKTTACLNDLPVKIVGSHQMLEDIALMRVLPGMVVVCPGDSIEAEKATIAIAESDRPCYLRLAREATPIFTTAESPFEIGAAYVLREGTDVTLAGTGTMTFTLLRVAEVLAGRGVAAEVIHVPTVKPLDAGTLLASVRRTGRIVTAEEGQVAGGFGGAVAELVSSTHPVPVLRCGVHDRYGETGRPAELLAEFGLDRDGLVRQVMDFLNG